MKLILYRGWPGAGKTSAAQRMFPGVLLIENDMFHIHTLYRRHGDIAQEVFDTAYEEPYYLDTSSFQFLSSVASDYMLRLAYGTYINEYEIEKRPMTKYIQDLRKQAIDNKLAGVNLRKR